jgi:hypothetical protein
MSPSKTLGSWVSAEVYARFAEKAEAEGMNVAGRLRFLILQDLGIETEAELSAVNLRARSASGDALARAHPDRNERPT